MKQRNVKKFIMVIILLLFGLVVGILASVRNRGDFVDKTVRKYNPQGTAVILIQNGEIAEVKNYGYADKASATSEDIAIFVKELIRYHNEGNKIMFQAQENTQSAGGIYALGIIPRELKNGKTVYEHNGTLTGWNAQIAFEPDSQNGIIVLSNSDKAYYMTYELMEKWGKEVLGQPVYDLQMQSITVRFFWT